MVNSHSVELFGTDSDETTTMCYNMDEYYKHSQKNLESKEYLFYDSIVITSGKKERLVIGRGTRTAYGYDNILFPDQVGGYTGTFVL